MLPSGCLWCSGTDIVRTGELTWRTCACRAVRKTGRSDHPAELVRVGQLSAWIDTGLVPVIHALWVAGIETK